MPNIYLQRDLGVIGDFIHSYRKDIKDEFIKNLHLYSIPKDYFDKKFVEVKQKKNNYLDHFIYVVKNFKNLGAILRSQLGRTAYTSGTWQMKPLLYNKVWVWEPTNKVETTTWQQQDGITFGTRSAYDTIKQNYPKLTEMLDKLREEYGIDSVNKATYSILISGGVIGVHTGKDNIHSKYVRCHIPLIIPKHKKEELYLEAGGDKVYWTETWGFDNQTPHTAKNITKYHRLVFIIDISRDALCLTKKKKSSKIVAYFKRLINTGREYN